MNKHIRNAVLAFICCMIWFVLFYKTYREVDMFNRVLRGFLAIAFFVNGILEIRNYKKSQNPSQKKDVQ